MVTFTLLFLNSNTLKEILRRGNIKEILNLDIHSSGVSSRYYVNIKVLISKQKASNKKTVNVFTQEITHVI